MKPYIETLQAGLSPKQKLDQIVEHGMCIGCGICQSIAGKSIVEMQLLESGFERPITCETLEDNAIETILNTCPGTHVEGLPEELIDRQTKHDLVWGAWREIYYAYSAEPAVRHLASTGGLLSGLALYLLESEQVDFILHAQASSKTPSFGEATISRNRNDVLRASGSRYGPTATLIDIINVVDKAEQNHERFAFIGTPCDVSALRNYAKFDSRVKQLCEVMLTMVCGGFMSPNAQQKSIEDRGIDYKEIVSMRYRGNGCPGPTAIKTTDGQTHEYSYLSFWGEDDSAWQLPPRCKVCPDGIGDSADIAASDTWDGGAPSEEESMTDLGFNAAIVRTQKGQDLMNNAIDAGYIVKGRAVTLDDMSRFQPHQVAKKKSVWARFEGMKRANNIFPHTKDLRIKRLSKLNSSTENQQQTLGSERRIKEGAFREQRPTSSLITRPTKTAREDTP